jgi:ferredoxin-nitrite reductase
MRAEQMHALSRLADHFGNAELRVTVWQNVILPNVPDERIEAALTAIEAIGFDTRASRLTGSVLACTGNTGCRFSATDTKGQALLLAQYLDERVQLDTPIDIHLTGCPHSCAQHYIADIGLLGVQVPLGEGSIEGYHVYVGGGTEQARGLGREIAKNIPFGELPPLLERLLRAYGEQRKPEEAFLDFARRHEVGALRAFAGLGGG